MQAHFKKIVNGEIMNNNDLQGIAMPAYAVRTVESLRGNGFEVVCFDKAEDAKDYILGEIAADQSVGFGGSMTIKGMGIYDELKARGNEVIWHWYPGDEDKNTVLRKAVTTDVYMSGINGITQDGRIVNVDGVGNRLAGILFGHDRLFLVAGINKISKNMDECMMRIRNESCALNARRLGRKTPCAATGKCMSCSSPDRMCNATLVLERQHMGIPTTVVLINEKLGF